jgi:hypothetical protein
MLNPVMMSHHIWMHHRVRWCGMTTEEVVRSDPVMRPGSFMGAHDFLWAQILRVEKFTVRLRGRSRVMVLEMVWLFVNSQRLILMLVRSL